MTVPSDKPLVDALQAVFEDLEKLNYFLPREEVERRVAREARRERLERGDPAILDDIREDIINDTLELTPHALLVVKGWVGAAFGKDPEARAEAPRFLVLSETAGGRGKTVAAAWAMANEVSLYITASEVRRIRFSKNVRDIDMLFRVENARFLVLDDLGAERLDDASEEWFFDLMNARQSRGRYTLITTNLDEPMMRARYGNRAVSRIIHQGGFVMVTGEDLRQRPRRRRARAASE